jgi:hypothetical protein
VESNPLFKTISIPTFKKYLGRNDEKSTFKRI